MIEIEVNNKEKMILVQTESDKEREGIGLETRNSSGKLERRDLIYEGDFVMLMNYYKYVKDNDIKDEFININGKNNKDQFSDDISEILDM